MLIFRSPGEIELKRCSAVIFVPSSLAYGAKPAPVYMDVVLKDFHTEQAGVHCSTTGNTNEVSMRTQIRMALRPEQ